MDKLRTEVLYNHLRPFFWVAIFYMLLGVTLLSGLLKQTLKVQRVFAIIAIPFLLHAAGFAARVYITGFAPVTNMYGTMIWMAFGVVLFGSVLFALYKNSFIYGLLLVGSSSVLLLTESIPLVLSPDMDPIVAVLRNNFWLTIHVLTISISYAAFTIAMFIGNAGLIQSLLRKDTPQGIKDLAHITYRAIQMGVFLLTAGIILGGWWADYSWGRFWGWDPKETWALIADLGFLSILHARYLAWLGPYGVLAAAPIAYLLVIMAWYGVNFILAAGLHSYGFSSGGTTMVVGFVLFQLILSLSAVAIKNFRMRVINTLNVQ
jgi:ABC-type transport system involved in cytochrome c biogenesis permease subunit